ncbi:hypothetical protein [Periweissella ghanensis]|uniref:Rad50/SbcC-type AAA domain-containing protein n=1 Tax=Periweissella ghanensis TaxID=467997 RepID=A0ABM8Z9L4_9LACO|nr:hypothetical protein [Periweissella ghanensis]MCM0601242.1 hypothetical protein [Periweissella ghanensis]CAH0418042.1 hypothetical protein WGH24286_00458 [Periweissella ghanensis]
MWVKYLDATAGFEEIKYTLDKKSNLITSNGHNTRGKTSFIRFLIWGLGFDVSLTDAFEEDNTNVELGICDNNKLLYKINRLGNVIYITEFGNIETITKYNLPDQELDVLQQLTKSTNKILLEQLIGAFYFDQDIGLRVWNRGKVVQKLKGKEKNYSLQIDNILCALQGLDYKKIIHKKEQFENKKKSVQKLKEAIIIFNNDYEVDHVDEEIDSLNNKLTMINFEIKKTKEKIDLYASGLKKQEKFFELIDELNMAVHDNDGNIVLVDRENLIYDKEKNNKLKDIETFYQNHLKNLYNQKKEINAKKDIHDNNLTKIENPELLYENLKNEINYSGIKIKTLDIIYEEFSKEIDKLKDELSFIVTQGKYNDLWNKATKYGNILNVENYFSYEKNKIRTKNLKYTGTKRNLLVFSYRLAIYAAIMEELNIYLPIVLDSPASQEMDIDNLNLMLNLIKNELPSIQLIVATNQKNNFKWGKQINITNGMFGNLDTNLLN